MGIEYIKLLLPFFVAETLNPEEQKEVEQTLKTHNGLQKDLLFWQRIKLAMTCSSTRTGPRTTHLTDSEFKPNPKA